MFLTENMAQLTNLEPGSDYNFEVRSIGDNNVQSMEATEIEETTCKKGKVFYKDLSKNRRTRANI